MGNSIVDHARVQLARGASTQDILKDFAWHLRTGNPFPEYEDEPEYTVLRDCDHPLLEDATLGEHDDVGEDPHCHYSVLTSEGGVVVNVDWGYHTLEEAGEHCER